MKISIIRQDNSKLYNFDVDNDTTIDDIKALLEVETNVKLANQKLLLHTLELENDKTVSHYNMVNNELLMMEVTKENVKFDMATCTVDQFISHLKYNNTMLYELKQSNPQLHDAVINNKKDIVESWLKQIQFKAKENKKLMELQLRVQKNPFDIEAQREIEQIIQQKNIEENMANAMEYTPESFGSVVMLYIDCEVNGHKMHAFVDSGAQMTIMSKKYAEKCDLLRLLDKRFAGVAQGVGTAKILGRIHLTQMKIGKTYFPVTITVLDQESMEFLLGLDMLKRHQCTLDFAKNHLKIGDEHAQFLSEHEIKKFQTGLPLHSSGNTLLSPLAPPTQNPFDVPQSSSTGTKDKQKQSMNTSMNQSSSRATSYSQADVDMLISLGFEKEKVLKALQLSEGNVGIAASRLLEKEK